jgi:glycosyltransferase involved in cell wall biosynthesis
MCGQEEGIMGLWVYTNGIRCVNSVLPDYDSNKIVFVGNMRTLQNQDAVIYFVSEIFPLVKKERPGAVFHVIGAEPPQFIKNMSDAENIIVSGFVKSVENEIKNAAVAVAPIRIAAGIQNKVLISMACGIPVVLTSLIASAVPELKSGVNCLIADNPKGISGAVISLLKNTDYRNAVAKNGYNLMKRAYSWNDRLAGYEVLDAV